MKQSKLQPFIPRKKNLFRFFLLPKSADGITTGLVWLAITSIVLTFFIAWKVPNDPDLFWHLKAGADILKNGIPHVDWYSHTMSNFAWIDHEYGQEIFMHLLENLGGFRLLSIVYALIVTFTLTVGLKWALPKKVSWGWILFAAPYIAVFSVSFLGTRPQMFTYLFVLLLIGLVRRYLKTQNVWLLIAVPVLFKFWANWHASFLAGLLILVAVTFAEAIKFVAPTRFKLGVPSNIRKVSYLSLTTILSVLATFINFYGVRIWLEIIRTLGDSELHNNITEWFAPDVHQNSGFIFFMILTTLLFALGVRKYRAELTDLFVLLLFTVSGYYSVRNIPLFLLFAVPFIVMTVREHWPGFITKLTRVWPVMVLLSLLIPLYVYKYVPIQSILNFDKDPKVAQEQGGYPLGALTFLREHPEYAEYKTFNNYGWGGYLLYYLPGFKSFIDGRMPSWEQDGTKIIDDYLKIDRLEDGYQALIAKHEIDYFIMPANHKLFTELARGTDYKEVYSDDIAKIYLKAELI